MRTCKVVIAALSAAVVGLGAGCPDGSKPADPAPKNGGGTQTINIDGKNIELDPDRKDTYEETVITTVEEIEDALRRIVGSELSRGVGLRHNQVLFLVDVEKNYYVQFEAVGQGTAHLRGEAASNQFIWGGEQNHLTAAQIARLHERGWKDPTGQVPNFQREWKTPSDPAVQKAAAEETMAVLREIYGLAEGGEIQMKLNLEQ